MPSYQSFHIPLRSSSVNAPTSEIPHKSSHGELKSRTMHKAQKILGTTGIALDSDYHRRPEKRTSRRPSFLNAPKITPKNSEAGASLHPHNLRVRASSPLLGQEYRDSNEEPLIPELSRRIHLSGSASALYSHYTSQDSPASSNLSFGTAPKELEPSTDEVLQDPNGGLSPTFKQPKGSMKDSKRKTRPPRIDLSLLFPKPQMTNAPLLSPHRMMSSPSPISVTSDHSVVKTGKPAGRSPGRKLTKAPPQSRVSTRVEKTHQTINAVLNSPESYDTESTNWADPALERTVRTSEMDLALEKDSDAQSTPHASERVRYSLLNFSSRSREQLHRSDSKPIASTKSGMSTESSQSTLRKMPSNIAVEDWNKETYSSSKTASEPKPAHIKPSQSGLYESRKTPMMSKKGSKNTLKNSDLNNSSVLCLSSSEDEDDEAESFRPLHRVDRSNRDSVVTYGEFEAEICTAAAAQAIKGTLRSVERPSSTSTRNSRPTPRPSNTNRESSTSLASKPSSSSRQSQSRRSSGIPAILEPDFFHNDPIFSQMRTPTLPQKEINRRSRLVAVTRREEHLLEAMRQRKGKITPSLLNESLDPDRLSIISGPSRDSFYCSETSFLRLSPGLPTPGLARALHATNELDKEVSTPRGTSSDSERKPANSVASRRTSLAYSESIPSSATSSASPLTPTLPIHRFSPLPSQKPPPRRPPPPVPDSQKHHSRRRTDSSEAIVLGSPSDDSKESSEFPIWALGWNNEGSSNVTTVH